MSVKFFVVGCLITVLVCPLQGIPLEGKHASITNNLQSAIRKYFENLPKAADWDMFVFAQEWPTTVCSSSSHSHCVLPEDKDLWTVHGLWPSKGSSGPSNCDTDAEFVEEDLDPILEDLQARWTDIFDESDKYSFWKHEWSKHGTCATQQSGLETPLKYFSKGLELNNAFSLSKILSENSILPGHSYTSKEFANVVESVTGTAVDVRCANSGKKRVQEIRICFDREFNLIDCTTGSNCGSSTVLYEDNN